MKELSTVKVFAENSKELYTAFKDYFDHTRADMGIKGKTFSAKSLDDKEKVINKLFADEVARRSKVSVADYEGDFAHYSQNPMVRTFADTIADQMIDMILPEVLFASVGLIADIRFIDWGDSAKFDLENNGLFTVAKAGYRQKNASFQKLEDTTVTLAPIAREVSVITSLYNVLTNRDSIAKYIMKAVRSIEAQMLGEAYEALAKAFAESTVPTKLKKTNFLEKDAITLAETVTAYNQGRKAVFVGTPVAIKDIVPANTSGRYLFDSEYVKVGYLPTFNTYDVVPMAQIADYKAGDYSLKLDDKKIYVISPSSDKLIKIVVGGTLSNTTGGFDNANFAQTGTIMKSWDVACITNSVAGQIALS